LVVEFDPVEARVIGSLAEKQLSTPQQYPLTLNALVLACNQSSNRDPVVNYDELVVEVALSSLKDAGFLRFVHPSHGRSVTRYRQVLDERFGLSARSLALLAVLLLRGPQTVGELRTRSERMADFTGLGEVEDELGSLSDLPEPLVRRLPRQPGQKEERWAQLLAGEPPVAPGHADAREGADAPAALRSGSVRDELELLRAELEGLREELAVVRADLDGFRASFGPV
jgi:uncharacterized protein YceH (UPF0502 family)